jgi:outer membrane protein TolC
MRIVSGLLITLCATTSAAAQTAGRVTVGQLVGEALARNPAIAAAQRRYDAARQRPAQERSLPDPMVSAGYNASGNPLPGAGLGVEPTANIGVMVSQELPFPGKRALRASIAAREADAELQNVEAARLDVAARVKEAYYGLAYTWAAGDVLTRSRDILDTLRRVSETRYAVGQAAQQDVIKAQTQISILDIQLERIRRQRATREAELNALRDRPPSEPVGRPEDLGAPAFEVALDALLAAAAERTPMLQRDAIMLDRAQLAADAARRDFKPDFVVSGGYAYMGSMPPMYEFRIDVKVPLQRARRAAAVAERVSSAEESRQSLAATRLALQSRIEADFEMASSSIRLARLYRETVLPQARLALESSMASYQTGAVDFLSVLTNFGTVLEYEMTYFEELASFHAAVSRLEAMTGAPVAD